jgi:hypothetical protein
MVLEYFIAFDLNNMILSPYSRLNIIIHSFHGRTNHIYASILTPKNIAYVRKQKELIPAEEDSVLIELQTQNLQRGQNIG